MRSVKNLSLELVLIAAVLATGSRCSASTKLTISPANPLQLGTPSLQFAATLNKTDVSKRVKWPSSQPSAAIINKSGLATLLSSGTTTITAAHGSAQASTLLTVTLAASPVFIVQPADANVSATINNSPQTRGTPAACGDHR